MGVRIFNRPVRILILTTEDFYAQSIIGVLRDRFR